MFMFQQPVSYPIHSVFCFRVWVSGLDNLSHSRSTTNQRPISGLWA